MKKPTISIIVPALNEEENIEAAVRKAIRLAEGKFRAYEIIIINDGSTDKTGEIIEHLRKEIKNIIIIHHRKPMGLGYSFKDGVAKAKYEYCALVAGDNEEEEESQQLIFDNVAKVANVDIFLVYPTNAEIRPLIRQFISKSFTLVMNLLFRLDLPYYSGGNIIRTKLLQNTPIYTSGFAYMPSLLVRLIKSGCSYKIVKSTLRKSEKTTLFNLKNILSVFQEVSRLFIEVNITDRSKYLKQEKLVI